MRQKKNKAVEESNIDNEEKDEDNNTINVKEFTNERKENNKNKEIKGQNI